MLIFFCGHLPTPSGPMCGIVPRDCHRRASNQWQQGCVRVTPQRIFGPSVQTGSVAAICECWPDPLQLVLVSLRVAEGLMLDAVRCWWSVVLWWVNVFCCCLLAVVEGTTSVSQLSLKYPGRVVCLQQRGSTTKTHNRGETLSKYKEAQVNTMPASPPHSHVDFWPCLPAQRGHVERFKVLTN